MNNDTSLPVKEVLEGQRTHWETAFAQKPEMFGREPSDPALKAAGLATLITPIRHDVRETLPFDSEVYNGYLRRREYDQQSKASRSFRSGPHTRALGKSRAFV